MVFLWNQKSNQNEISFKIIEEEIIKLFKKADMFIGE